MKKILLIFSLLIVVGLNAQNYTKSSAGQPTGNSSEVGITSGQLSVSLTGGARYQVPIAVPPGINGIAPQISLAYNSQGGNGLAGYGWNLSGISAITRIAATKFHDGLIDGVDFDANDRFALDGQRLILKSGVYGKNSAVYETEMYSNLKIVSFGDMSQSSAYFKVFYPDGTVAVYGGSSDSTNKNIWSIKKWYNSLDIRLTYYYTKSNNSLYINKIHYGTKSSSTALNTIKFIYKNRIRPEQAYVNGMTFINSRILSEIIIKGKNSSSFRKYSLEHDVTSLGYERLTKITEESGNKSYNPTVFTYNNTNNNDLFNSKITNLGLTNTNFLNTSYISGDFNGDSKMDVIAYPITGSKSKKEYWLFTDIANGGLNQAKTHNIGRFEDIFPVSLLNHSNKLKSEQGWVIIQKIGSLYKFKVAGIGTPSSGGYPGVFYDKTWQQTYTSKYSCDSSPSTYAIPQKFISGDFNGDGLTDVIAISKSYSYSSCYRTNNPNEPCIEDPRSPNISQDSIQSSNLRRRPPSGGDDCCQCNSNTSRISKVSFIDLNRNNTSNFSNTAGYLSKVLPNFKTDYDIQVGDFNGDGKSDFFIIQENKMIVYSLDNNNRLITLVNINFDTDIDKDKPHLLGDFNGDGKMDVVMPTTVNQDRWAFYFSKGNGFHKKISSIGEKYVVREHSIDDFYFIANDINNDGKADIIKISSIFYTPRNRKNSIIDLLENNIVNSNTISFNHYTKRFRYITGSHHPLPIFLNQNNLNQNLELALLGGSVIHHFKHSKDNRQDVLLRQIISGNGVVETINYHALVANDNDPEIQVYRPTYNEAYPFIDIKNVPAIQVVSKLEKQSDNQYSKQLFSYYGAVSNVEGLGFIGFKSLLRSNWFHDGISPMMSVSKHDITKRGAVYESYLAKGFLYSFENTPNNFVNKTTNNYSIELSSRKVFKLNKNSTISYNRLQNTSVITSISYDNYNNPITSTVVTKQGGAIQQSKISSIIYQNNANGGSSFSNPYYIGIIKQKNNETIVNGNSYTTEERNKYSNSLLVTQKKYKGTNTSFITENYNYDTFGNVTKKTIIANGNSRANSFEYESSGRFLTKEVDIEGLRYQHFYDPNGLLTKDISPYGITTQYVYDLWGKRIREIDYLGNQTIITYSRIGGNNLQIDITNPDDSKIYKRFDDLGREIITASYGLNDKWTYIKTDYDIYNRKISISEPYFSSPSQYKRLTYDSYGRLKQIRSASGKTTDLTYNGLTTTVTDGYKTVSTSKNALGQVINTTDDGGTINYTYFAHGGLKQSAFGTAITIIQYDGWGRKIKLTDPSAGVYQYEYNSFGDTTKEITPKGETTYILDAYGKLTQKIIQGEFSNSQAAYSYDSSTKLLKNIHVNNGTTYTYTYDNYKRLKKTTEANIPHVIFERSSTYDNLGRKLTERYKAKYFANNKTSDITIRNEYKNGGLFRIRNNAGQSQLWKVNAISERGRVIDADFGNNIKELSSYDAYGLPTRIRSVRNNNNLIDLNFNFNIQRGILISRSSNLYIQNESFQYDNLNRLTRYTDSSGRQQIQNYDGKGRITNNLIGTYKYANTSKPYQNTSIDLSGGHTLYDGGKGVQNISYNAFKAPVHISTQTGGNTKEEISFGYNVFQQRSSEQFKKVDSQEVLYKTKLFSWDGSMEVIRESSEKFITFIGGDAYSAPVIYKSNGSSGEFLYLHRDYLGSIIAISNSKGELIEKRHFDAWGKITMIKDQNGNALDKLTVLDRGYTGHEHLQSVDLINMNARLYDANLHRFLAPDNFVQDPYNTQNYNRYSYVLNNPLSYVDNSGEWFGLDDAIAALIGGVVNLAVNAFQGNINSWGDGFAAFGAGAAAGTLALYGPAGWIAGGAIVGGTNAYLSGANNFNDILKGTVVGAVSGLAGGVAGQWAARSIGGIMINGFNVASPVVKGFIGGILGGGAGGYAGGFVGGYIMTGDFSLAHKSGIQGAITGGAIGGVAGGVGGYVSAKQSGINPWNGKDISVIKTVPDGNFYSVAYEMELSADSYPGFSRYLHFKEANISLSIAMETNPLLSELGISVPRSSVGNIIGKSPSGWVWNHGLDNGIMQLVPKAQHPNIPGGIFWDTMHPGGIGGFSIWGR